MLGIDLGTTNSCVAVWTGGRAEVLSNGLGNHTTPSVVGIKITGDAGKSETLVGEAAMNELLRNVTGTFYNIKRLIGLPFQDESVQAYVGSLPFQVVAHPETKRCAVVVGEEIVPVQQISSMVLTYLRCVGTQRLGHEVEGAVITVPAKFGSDQRQATREAALAAGFSKVHLLSEPTAAAIAYGDAVLTRRKESSEPSTVLVVDIGGGTFDMSLLRHTPQQTLSSSSAQAVPTFKVLATDGNPQLGGHDFDTKVLELVITNVAKKRGVNLLARSLPSGMTERDRVRALTRLRRSVRAAKHQLSHAVSAVVEVEGLMRGDDYRVNLSRARFDQLCDFKTTCVAPVTRFVTSQGLRPDQVDHVVLVGGSCRIPAIVSGMQAVFGEDRVSHELNADEAIAMGAATFAHAKTSGGSSSGEAPLVQDVLPLSIGIKVNRGGVSGIMQPLLERNTPLPASCAKEFSVLDSTQKTARVELFEGDRTFTADNHFLGDFTMENVGQTGPALQVGISVDEDGIVHVSGHNLLTGEVQNVRMRDHATRAGPEKIAQMREDSKQMCEVDAERAGMSLSRMKIVQFCRTMQPVMAHSFSEARYADITPSPQEVKVAVDATTQWLEARPNGEGLTEGDYEARLEALTSRCRAMIFATRQDKLFSVAQFSDVVDCGPEERCDGVFN